MQFRVAQPGEVLGAGGTVLNLVDLSDVYMTFFVPETVAGRVALGSEVRIVLDAAPQYVIPARVSYVASVAQFTPKTVETASERQKLMFRVRAQIAPRAARKAPGAGQDRPARRGLAQARCQRQWPAELALNRARNVPRVSRCAMAPRAREPVVRLSGVGLRYGKTVALDGIDAGHAGRAAWSA